MDSGMGKVTIRGYDRYTRSHVGQLRVRTVQTSDNEDEQ
jgi:hypothetical protein